jgi:hypothetical protein
VTYLPWSSSVALQLAPGLLIGAVFLLLAVASDDC